MGNSADWCRFQIKMQGVRTYDYGAADSCGKESEGDKTEIRSRSSVDIFRTIDGFCGIQTVRCDEMGTGTADLGSFLVHQHGKRRNVPADMLCNGYGSIIVGFEHKGVKQVAEPVIFARIHVQLHIRHGSGILADTDQIVRISVLQRENTGHDFGGACIGTDLGTGFAIQDSPAVRIHQTG